MSPRLVRLLLAAGTALQVHTILRARRYLRDSLNLDGDPDGGCGSSWCPCEAFDYDDEPTYDLRMTGDAPAIPTDDIRAAFDNTIARCDVVFANTDGRDRCEKAAGHDGLHSGGGYLWLNIPGEAAA